MEFSYKYERTLNIEYDKNRQGTQAHNDYVILDQPNLLETWNFQLWRRKYFRSVFSLST